MIIEEIKHWYANHKSNPDPCFLMVQLVQHAFQTSIVPLGAWSKILVLIPKPEVGQVHSIGLLEQYDRHCQLLLDAEYTVL